MTVPPASQVTDLGSVLSSVEGGISRVGSTTSPESQPASDARAALRSAGVDPGPGTIVPHGTGLRRHRSREEVAAALERRGHLRGRRRRPPAPLVRAHHVPLPVGPGPHGPRPQLHVRRPAGPPPDHARLRRALPVRVRLVRPAGRERRHQDRHPPPDLHRRPHRRAEGVDHSRSAPSTTGAARSAATTPSTSGGTRSSSTQAARRRAGLPGQRPGQLVPGLPDRAGQRAGPGRRHL